MTTLKKILKWVGGALLVLVAVGFILYLIYVRPVLKIMEHTSVVQYDPQLTLVIGGGGNSGILVSDSLVVVVDTKMGDAAEEFSKTVHDIAGKKPILVVNTHYHFDHTSGNKFFSGQSILAGGNYTKEIWLKNASAESMPTVWLKDRTDIKMGDETVTILNMPRHAHTESDVFVYLHKRKILFGGDVILNRQIPSITSGGVSDPQGYLAAYDMLPKEFDVQQIVPGHGAVGGLEIITNLQHYFADMSVAAKDDAQKAALVAKYKDWLQVPFLMSPANTIDAFKK